MDLYQLRQHMAVFDGIGRHIAAIDAAITVGPRIGAEVVAEGISEEGLVEPARTADCTHVEGFHYTAARSKPRRWRGATGALRQAERAGRPPTTRIHPRRETGLPSPAGAATLPAMSDTQFHAMPDGRRIAYRLAPGRGPALVFLPGYMSDMAGGKATAVFDWARVQGRAALLLDYSGCGESPGDFADGTLSRWREEVLALIAAHCRGEVVLIGSSMGGWLMLLCALALPGQMAAIVGIAPAPDFTDWGTIAADQARLAAGEKVLKENPYGPEPTPTYPGFWADGQANRLLTGEIALDCPVRLIHGQEDADVPWDISLRLAELLRSADVQVTLIKDGDHRLSREGDIALLLRTLAGLTG